MARKKKSELTRLLEASIKAAKKGELPGQRSAARYDSLGNRLRHLDRADVPDALEVGPEALDRPGESEWGDD